MSDHYLSSETIQRSNSAFVDETNKKTPVDQSERDRLVKALDKHIDDHSKTVSVRSMALKNNRDVSYQLDLSADIVEMLQKIKTELGK